MPLPGKLARFVCAARRFLQRARAAAPRVLLFLAGLLTQRGPTRDSHARHGPAGDRNGLLLLLAFVVEGGLNATLLIHKRVGNQCQSEQNRAKQDGILQSKLGLQPTEAQDSKGRCQLA